MPIRHYLKDEAVFDPDEIEAMSIALEGVCKELKLDPHPTAKETVAIRIIELTRLGERDPARLRVSCGKQAAEPAAKN